MLWEMVKQYAFPAYWWVFVGFIGNGLLVWEWGNKGFYRFATESPRSSRVRLAFVLFAIGILWSVLRGRDSEPLTGPIWLILAWDFAMFFVGRSNQELTPTSQNYFDRARRLDASLSLQPYHEQISQQEIDSRRQNPNFREAEELYKEAALMEESKSGSLKTWPEVSHLSNAINAYLQLSLLHRRLCEFEEAKTYAIKVLDLLRRFSKEIQQHPEKLAMKTEALFRLTEIDHFLKNSTTEELIQRYEEILAIDRLANNADGVTATLAMLDELHQAQYIN